MALLSLLLRFLFDDDFTHGNERVRNHNKVRDKHIAVKHKNRQTRYRINQYGEVFEE